MDGTATDLKKKLDQLLHQAAEVSVALDRAEGILVGVPHYSVIELRAHGVRQRILAVSWVTPNKGPNDHCT